VSARALVAVPAPERTAPAQTASDADKLAFVDRVIAPRYFKAIHRLYGSAPLPKPVHGHPSGNAYERGQIPPVVPQNESDDDPSGKNGSYQPDGGTPTASNAFFEQLGTNGRSCVTCHQPPSG
jgi:hypothetical protein